MPVYRVMIVALCWATIAVGSSPTHAELFGFSFLNNNSLAGYGVGQGRITHVIGQPKPQGCGVMEQTYGADGLWRGSFLGSRENINDAPIRVGGIFCFRGERACRFWLRDMQDINKEAIRANDCRPYR